MGICRGVRAFVLLPFYLTNNFKRTTRGSSDCDAVAVVPRLFGRNEVEKTILVRQFRPPLDSYTLENVAGLVDDGETPEQVFFFLAFVCFSSLVMIITRLLAES